MPEEDDDDVFSQLGWVSSWGAAALVAATLAVVQAQLMGLRLLTLGLTVIGLGLVFLGFHTTQEDRQPSEWTWFVLAGALNGLILILGLFLPGVLNSMWALDTAVPRANLDAQILVPRDTPLDIGAPLSKEEAAEAETQGIRQEDVFVRIESVKVGPLPGAKTSYLLIHLRLANCKVERTIKVVGFDLDSHVPVLTDEAGTSFPFQEQRRRRQAKGSPVFEAVTGPQNMGAASYQDYLLAFTAPPTTIGPWILEVPATAWGRKGICKFRIPQVFVAPSSKKGESKP